MSQWKVDVVREICATAAGISEGDVLRILDQWSPFGEMLEMLKDAAATLELEGLETIVRRIDALVAKVE